MILKFLLTAFLIYITFILFRNSKKLSGNSKDEIGSSPVELVKDPICGTFVEMETPYKVKLYDNIYYFCSEDCREKFIAKNKKEG